MDNTYHERCLKCKWLAPKLNPPCGRLFGAQVAVSPLGGTIDINFTPGMIPVEMESKMQHFLGKVFEFMTQAIQTWPGWDELAVVMSEDKDKQECPGRIAMDNPFLRVVK